MSSPPLKLSTIAQIELPTQLRNQGVSLRVKNLNNGKFVLIPLNAIEKTIPLNRLMTLVSSSDELWFPEFSLLLDRKSSVPVSQLPEALLVTKRSAENRKTIQAPKIRDVSKELFWKKLGYRLSRDTAASNWTLRLAENVLMRFLTVEQAEQRRQAQESAAVQKLFDIGWRSIAIAKNDLASQAFEKLIARSSTLNSTQRAQAHLGLSIVRFNDEGCSSVLESELLEADRDPANQDDVTYYRALCALEEESFKKAENLFAQLSEKSHQQYGESSAFYLGVIAEKDGRLEQAESAFLDTADFANDPGIVALAKERLTYVRYLKKRYELSDSILRGGISFTTAYDTNAVALPQELSPADYGLSKESSAFLSNLAFLSLTPPWSPSFNHQINYNFFVTHYLTEALVEDYDSMIHDIGTTFGFASSSTISHSLSASFTTIRVGSWGASYEALRSHSLNYQLKQLILSKSGAVEQSVDYTLRFSNILLMSALSSPDFHPGSEGVGLDLKLSQLGTAAHAYGPKFSIEYRPARGREVSLGQLSFGGFWDYRFAGNKAYVSQEAGFTFKDYYQSAGSREDYQLNYIGTLGRGIGSSLDVKLRYQGTLNVSSTPATSQYSAHKVGLVLSAYF
ncbi:MAG: hypothetical protein GW917_01115 [Bdellovibrionales bacterium]|nr:hypothetical protein [Bdellovibrionales bacterium]